MRILHVSGATSWGGNEQQLLFLVDELDKLGIRQLLFCFENTPLYENAIKYPLEVIAIKKSKPFSSLYRNTFKSAVNDKQPDIIHLHTSDSVTGYVVTDLLHKLDTPTVFAKKGIGSSVSVLSRMKYNYKNIDRIICVSEYVKENFKKELKENNYHKLLTVHDGVRIDQIEESASFDLRKKLNLSPGSFVIGNIANHTRAKSLSTLINVAEELVKQHNFLKFHVVQIGQHSKLTPLLKEQVQQKGLETYISFMGFVEDASAFLPQFDVFVMTSEREGGPSSIMEAFYKKTPVLSTKVGVVDEAIVDGENGFVAEPGDSKSLAKKILQLKNNPELAEKFKERAYQLFQKKFTAKELGSKTLEVYNDLLKDKK